MIHQVVTSTTGIEFGIEVDDRGRIVAVAGPWPEEEGAEFVLSGSLPDHKRVDDLPDHISTFAAERGRHVCYYDPDACQTCFCDASGSTLYCRKMC
jgi:hypothetical protein